VTEAKKSIKLIRSFSRLGNHSCPRDSARRGQRAFVRLDDMMDVGEWMMVE
jgi:hypothetical protein